MEQETPDLSPSYDGERDNFDTVDMENSDDDAKSVSESSQMCPTPGRNDYPPSNQSTNNQSAQPLTPQHYTSDIISSLPPKSPAPQLLTHDDSENNSTPLLSNYSQQLPSSQSTTSSIDDKTNASHHSSLLLHRDADKRHSDDTTKLQHRPTKRIVQVLNVSPMVTLEQITTLFETIGSIDNILMYPNSDAESSEKNFKVCFIEFAKAASALVALHLTNTVFVDRALIVSPYNQHELPDLQTAMEIAHNSDMIVQYDPGFFNQIVTGVGGAQFIATINPRLITMGLSQYPTLPINTEPARIEEIRRTVYVGNLDSTIHPDQVLKFFNDIGEVKYIRVAGDESQPTRFAFVEFTHQSSIASAVQHNGVILGSRALKINHSNNAIVKPQPRIEIEDPSKIRRDRDSHRLREDRHSTRRDRTRDRSRERSGDRSRDRNQKMKERYRGRRVSPYSRGSRSRHRRSSDREISPRRRSRSRSQSRDRAYRRSRSPKSRGSRRSRSRDEKRRRVKNVSDDRSSSRRHRSHR